jgi:hypothetical protein
MTMFSTQPTGQGIVMSILTAILILFIINTVFFLLAEGFLFQVSEGRRNCLSCKGNCNCCSAGTHGKPVEFEYTGDAERINCDSCVYQRITNNPNDYLKLNQIYPVEEGYCGNVHEGYTYANLKQTGTSLGGSCGSSNQVVEGFEGCSSCSL